MLVNIMLSHLGGRVGPISCKGNRGSVRNGGKRQVGKGGDRSLLVKNRDIESNVKDLEVHVP